MPAPGSQEKVEGCVCSRAVTAFCLNLIHALTFASSQKELCYLLFLFCFVKWRRVCTELFSCLLNSRQGAVFPLPPEDRAVAESRPLFPLKSSGI